MDLASEMSRPPESDLPVVLVVDDEEAILLAVRRQLRRSGVEILQAVSPAEAIAVLNEREVAVLISDYMMPGMNGIELLAMVRRRWPRTVGIMMTACEDIRIAADAVNRGLVKAFITKPWNSDDLRRSVADCVQTHRNRLEGRSVEIEKMAREIAVQARAGAFALARAVDARDPNTHQHSEKVALYAEQVGKAMGLPDGLLEDLRIGGLLHDLGKIGVPDQVLLKPGRLDDAEFDLIRRHPRIGASIVEPMGFSEDIRAIIRHHHESHDGRGYPDGLAGGEIALPARIVHVVDAFEAMTADRVYRKACSLDYVRDELRKHRGTQFDPQVADVFLAELDAGRIPGFGLAGRATG
ncbi:MAG: response regulator [Deltaproteobacteria bacterium]|nr:response regulator [Deltaproteobacteria bacterium]